MKRRELIYLLGTSIFYPARAQEKGQVRRVAVLAGGPESDSAYMPFQQELKKLGWELGRNIQIDYVWSVVGERARIAPAELLRLQPDVVLSVGTPAIKELQRQNPAALIRRSSLFPWICIGQKIPGTCDLRGRRTRKQRLLWKVAGITQESEI
jgi:hypothetical protein